MQIKPGIKTSELAVTVLLAAGSVAAAAAGVLPARYAALASAISVAAYNIARGLAKVGPIVTTPAAQPTPPAPTTLQPPAS